ncbi:MAG TPA: aldo/keto reductase [Tepidisphaeraceae bacterium]|jgi:aryl-alcohol dehydrogenase-like predicted oxidoreductase|nr:aldo/keto reductase [Tepidisphaeraceae bacterium]HEV8605509.1 aldo/keto reductase [Tepidisphaeraceae bacterium]
MKYRRLGKTNLNVSVIGLGTWQFGGEWGKEFTQDEANQILGRAQQLGINLIDTAECYGDHTSERLIGSATKNQRDKWIIATKFGHRFLGYMKRSDDRSPADVQKQLEDSLKALQSDYIDIYQFHSVRDNEFFNETLWKILFDAKRAGKIRHIGNSISSGLDGAPQADASTRAQVEALQVLYNRLDRRPEEKILPSAQKQDLGVLARVPLASGFLTGKYKPGTKFQEGDVRHEQKPQEVEKKLREVERIAREEVPPGVPMAHWALAWCLRHPAVTAVIPGCKDVHQVESNAKAADLVGN